MIFELGFSLCAFYKFMPSTSSLGSHHFLIFANFVWAPTIAQSGLQGRDCPVQLLIQSTTTTLVVVSDHLSGSQPPNLVHFNPTHGWVYGLTIGLT